MPPTRAGFLRSRAQLAVIRKIRRHKFKALFNAGPCNKTHDNYQVRKFLEFQRTSGARDPVPGLHAANAVTFSDFVWWIQRCTNVNCIFKQARSFVRAAARRFKIKGDPFVALSKDELQDFAKAFDKEAVIVHKVNLPFSRNMAAHMLSTLWNSTRANDDELHSALLIHLVTSLRPGNVLKGSSDSENELALKLSNVYESKASATGVASMFILNDRQKNSKGKPVLTAVPFNQTTKCPYKECAATKLKAAYKRRKAEGASPNDCVFINARSKKPLTTKSANSRIQQIAGEKFVAEDNPSEWKSFFTLKSARKTVASHMAHLGCAPQTVASQLKHGSIQSQMSYVCKFYKKKSGLVDELYKDL